MVRGRGASPSGERPKKASGRVIPEEERGGKGGGWLQVKLRLTDDVKEELDNLAKKWGLTRSGTVARLLERERGEE